jgi:hypothetical protein
MLFVQGTRDAFAREDLLGALVARLGPRAELVPRAGGRPLVLGAPKRSGRTPADVVAEVAAALLGWLDRNSL